MVLNHCIGDRTNRTNLFEKYLCYTRTIDKQTFFREQTSDIDLHCVLSALPFVRRISIPSPDHYFPNDCSGVSCYFCGQIKWVCFWVYSVDVQELRRKKSKRKMVWHRKHLFVFGEKSINGILNFHPLIDLHSHIIENVFSLQPLKSKNVTVFPWNLNNSSERKVHKEEK